jgi:hypothetical protein
MAMKEQPEEILSVSELEVVEEKPKGPEKKLMKPPPTPEQRRAVAEAESKQNLLRRQMQLDEAMVKLPVDPDRIGERNRQNQTLEGLRSGVKLKGERLGKASANLTERQEVEGPEGKVLTLIAKPQKGETSLDREGYVTKWDSEIKAYKRASSKPIETFRVIGSEEHLESMAKALAKQIGVPAEEYPSFKAAMQKERQGIRADIPVDGLPARETAVSRLDMMLNFGIVPPTAMRAEMGEAAKPGATGSIEDLASVQQFVEASDAKQPPREAHFSEFKKLVDLPPDQWSEALGVKSQSGEPQGSLTKMACLDWLAGTQDRHFENMLVDPASGKFHAIDNGLSFGAARGAEMTDDVGKKSEQFRMLRSIPLELIQKNPSLALDDETRAQLKKTYDGVIKGGPEKAAVEAMFKMLFEDKRIAKKQMQDFLSRMIHLSNNGRPPELVTSKEWSTKSGEKIYPVWDSMKEEYAKKEEKARARQAATA